MKFKANEMTLAFQASDGRMVVVSHPGGAGLFQSPDGRQFEQLYGTNVQYNMSRGEFAGACEGSTEPRHHLFERRTEGPLTFDGTSYELVETPTEIDYEPLPITVEITALFMLGDGTYVCFSERRFEGYILGSRAYIGPPEAMRQIKVTGRFERSPRIETESGILWLAQAGQSPGWTPVNKAQRKRALPVDLDQVDVVLVEQGATFTFKSKTRVATEY